MYRLDNCPNSYPCTLVWELETGHKGVWQGKRSYLRVTKICVRRTGLGPQNDWLLLGELSACSKHGSTRHHCGLCLLRNFKNQKEANHKGFLISVSHFRNNLTIAVVPLASLQPKKVPCNNHKPRQSHLLSFRKRRKQRMNPNNPRNRMSGEHFV